MPKHTQIPSLQIDLLKPQGNPEKIEIRLTKWVLSTGRYMIIFVELIVLAAFLARFKFDADLASYSEEIEQRIPFIESLQTDEVLVRKLQKQLATIKEVRQGQRDYAGVFQKIADQTPQQVQLNNITLGNASGKTDVKITGISLSNNALATLIAGLRQDQSFSDINLASIGVDKGTISFTITASVIADSVKRTTQ